MGGQAYSAGRSSDPEVLAEAAAHIEAACQRAGVEIRQAAFRWLFNHSGLAAGDGVITGTVSAKRSLLSLSLSVSLCLALSLPLCALILSNFLRCLNKLTGLIGARSLEELQTIVEPMCEESGPLPADVVAAIDTAWQDIVGGHTVYPTRDLPDFARL
jgi:hypothetical protein